jgi:hypothetical protein
VENRPSRLRKTTITTIIASLTMLYMLAPRPQPTTDYVTYITYEKLPAHIEETLPAETVKEKPAETIEDYARQYTDTFDEWECLYELWWHESKWDYTAAGPTNDWGIPQANADAHPETSQARWRADKHEQVRWGISYINDRYGSMCAAWDTWKRRATQRDDGTWHGGWY